MLIYFCEPTYNRIENNRGQTTFYVSTQRRLCIWEQKASVGCVPRTDNSGNQRQMDSMSAL